MIKANRMQMKEINKNIVRLVLKQCVTATKPELSALTNLSVVTVNTLISEMVTAGEVLKGEEVPSNGGRPSRQYIYNGNYKLAVIIYGHEEKNMNLFHLLVINLFGECIEKKTAICERVSTNSFDEWINDAFTKYKNISLISFGLPGVEENGVIIINDYPEIIGDKFLSFYQEKYQVPVIFENDVNAAVSGYYTYQDTSKIKNAVGLYYPRSFGPGSGIIIKGEIYKGSKNFAGEFAWITTKPSWNEVDFDNMGEVAKMLSQVVLIYSCILAPECFVLYGDFLTEELKEEVERRVKELLQEKFTPYMEFKKNLKEDFERGMIAITMKELVGKEGKSGWY